jgi:hypothetical protein
MHGDFNHDSIWLNGNKCSPYFLSSQRQMAVFQGEDSQGFSHFTLSIKLPQLN